MSSVMVSISGGFLEPSKAETREGHEMFRVAQSPGAMTDAYIHLTADEAAQWAAVLNKFAGENY